jgi:hypothetical protein
MKKPITFVIVTVVAIYLISRIFSYYNSTHILSNQAVFNIYLDLNENDIDSFFGLKKGTFNKKKHTIICQLPVYGNTFKSIPVSFNINNIDCSREFNNEIDTKYDNSELGGNDFKLVIVKGWGGPIALFDANLPIFENSIVSYKDITTNYTRGKINNIVISTNRVYDYCTK